MICRSCLRRASALRINRISHPIRNLSTTLHRLTPETTSLPETRTTPAAATSTGLAQPFSNPLTPSPGAAVKAKAKLVIPDSIAPAGTPLTGLNYLKGRDDPLALEESEYPEWLWRVLDKQADASGDDAAGDEFSKSKKLRRKAAKSQRKLEARLQASGDMSALAPKIPITQQSVDLPANAEGSVQGALEAERVREDLTAALRKERRKGIKNSNFLKSM